MQSTKSAYSTTAIQRSAALALDAGTDCANGLLSIADVTFANCHRTASVMTTQAAKRPFATTVRVANPVVRTWKPTTGGEDPPTPSHFRLR